MNRLAQFDMSNELLCQLLNFPEGTNIVTVRESNNPSTFNVVIQNPDFPESDGRGFNLPRVNPGFETIHQQATHFLDWNIVESEVE